jgi:hypothetical protein
MSFSMWRKYVLADARDGMGAVENINLSDLASYTVTVPVLGLLPCNLITIMIYYRSILFRNLPLNIICRQNTISQLLSIQRVTDEQHLSSKHHISAPFYSESYRWATSVVKTPYLSSFLSRELPMSNICRQNTISQLLSLQRVTVEQHLSSKHGMSTLFYSESNRWATAVVKTRYLSSILFRELPMSNIYRQNTISQLASVQKVTSPLTHACLWA